MANMQDTLATFTAELGAMNGLKENMQHESVMISKLIKNEVIDMAEKMDSMQNSIDQQSLMMQ